MRVGVPILPFQDARQKNTTMEVVDLMVHPFASIMGTQLYNIGDCRPCGPPSCLNHGKSIINQHRLSNKNPIMLLCVTRFHSSLGREVMHYFTIHDLTIQDFKNTLLTRDFGVRFHYFNNMRSSCT